jgi:hypothetical protein
MLQERATREQHVFAHYRFYITDSMSHEQHQTGALAEWLLRKTRNLIPSGAQVRILWASIENSIFAVLVSGLLSCGSIVIRIADTGSQATTSPSSFVEEGLV